MGQTVLEMIGIKKSFSGIYALSGIDFSLELGEVHALLGENGAGKSTLIKVLGGIYQPDCGAIKINGKEVNINGLPAAREAGIGIIHQEIVLVPYLTVAQNIFLGREITTKSGTVDFEKMKRFISYLVHDVYSFGKPKTVSRKEADGSLRTITTNIDFYNLKLDGETILEYEQSGRPKLSLSAPLFERYALDIHLKKKQTAVKQPEANKVNKKAEAVTAPKQSSTFTNIKKTDGVVVENTAKAAVLKNVEDSVKIPKNMKDISRAKMAKFKRDPYQFCEDSQKPILRMLRHFFKKH